MNKKPSTDQSATYLSRGEQRPALQPTVLWHLRGATDDLRGLAVETSYGYALGLELDAELVLLHLQPSLECLIAYADRIEAALVAQGWHIVAEHPTHTITRELH